MNKRAWTESLFRLLLYAALIHLAQPSFAQGKKVGEIGGWNINIDIKIEDLKGFFNDVGKYGNKAWKIAFTRHKDIQQIFTIDGKSIVAVPLRSDAGGTRLTHNINFDPAWKQDVWVTVMVANVPNGSSPAEMTFQQKYDEDWDDDPNVGPIMKHGDRIKFNPGHGRYIAHRSGPKYWGAVILFIEDGVAPDQLKQLPGNLKIEKR